MKRIFSTTLFGILFSLEVFAQSGGLGMYFVSLEKRGDRLFENYAYLDALETYQRALKKEGESDGLSLKVAEAYRKLNQPAEAVHWYEKVKDKETAFKPEHEWYYAEALSSTGNYQKAKKWYALYQQSQKEDSRVAKKLESLDRQSMLKEKNAAKVSIQPAPFNSGGADFSPAFYEDGLVFLSARKAKENRRLFLWDRSAFLDIYYSKGSDGLPVEPFDKTINSPYHEGPLVFYANDTRLIFTRNNFGKKLGKSSNGITKLKLYYSQKTDSVSWTAPEPLPFNSEEFSTGHPAITSDGSLLYFASDRPGGYGGTDLYKVEWKEGQWQAPVNLGSGINTEGNELFPFLHQDQQLFFASNGHGGLGGLDIFGVDRSSGSEAEVINLGAPLNSSFDDFGLVLREAGNSGYFSSNRPGGEGNDDVYSFTAGSPLLSKPEVSGRILSEADGMPLEGVKVYLLNTTDSVLESMQTTGDGTYSFGVEPEESYQLKAEKPGFRGGTKKFTATGSEESDWVYDLSLAEKERYSLYAFIENEKTKEGITGVQVSLTDNLTGELLLEDETGSDGDFFYALEGKKARDKVSVQLKLTKKGFFSKTLSYETVLEETGQIRLHELMEMRLDQIKLGMDIGKQAGVQPIYFDLGKHNIRPEAATELDKIVALMKENPSIAIELGSHTDARGSNSSNLELSDKRAKASVHYITSQGIDASRIAGRGFGESKIKNRCAEGVRCSEEEHRQNRRTEFTVTRF